MRIRSMMFAAGLALALTDAAAADQGRGSRDPCDIEGRETECYLAHERESLDIYGLAPAAELAAAGTEIRRVMFIDGYGRNLVAVEFRRAAGTPPQVRVHLPRGRSAAGAAEPDLTNPVMFRDWQSLAERGQLFDRALPARATTEDGQITICSHGWIYLVEYTDPQAEGARERIRRRVESACTHGTTADYASFLAEVAVSAIPGCAALDADNHRNDATILSVCARFTGDTISAAQAHNAIAELRGGGHPDHLPLLTSIFRNARLDWQGEPILRGAPAAWLARTSGDSRASFFPGAVHGESARRVRMNGELQRWIDRDGRSVLEVAPVELIWSQSPPELWAVERATVHPFFQVPGICPPGLLTGAERANNCRR